MAYTSYKELKVWQKSMDLTDSDIEHALILTDEIGKMLIAFILHRSKN